jgi:DNA-3-methyladenine glycosylase II
MKLAPQQAEFSITPLPPFRLDLTAWALRRRPENEMDHWDGTRYRRVLMIDRQLIAMIVRETGEPEQSRLQVTLKGAHITTETRATARTVLERMLGLRVNLQSFYQMAARDRKISSLVKEFRGLKPPRFPSVFEAVVNGIACQQLSLLVGILLLNRLTRQFGGTAKTNQDSSRAFPDPARLTSATTHSLRKLGFNTHKANGLIELSSAIHDQHLDLEGFEALGNQSALQYLLKLRGVGRWTAEYVLLRGLGRLDMFPGDDAGARNSLARFCGRTKALDYDSVRRTVAGWQPYAGLIYFHLLLLKIKKAGWLDIENENALQSA